MENFRALFDHAYKTNEYYRSLFDRERLTSSDFQHLRDLTRIPVTTKSDIRNNISAFSKSRNEKVIPGSTGGSTGEPLKFEMSRKDYALSKAILLRMFSRAGYVIGDRVIVFAGGSLTAARPSRSTTFKNWLLNFEKHSSYGVSEVELKTIVSTINTSSPSFLRGYASSLALLAEYVLIENPGGIGGIRAVFSTAEALSRPQRRIIEKAFQCRVFDQYGLNDGGVSAAQDDRHAEYLVDSERGILEVETESIGYGSGRILATALFNFEYPFIRYDTGDSAKVDRSCYGHDGALLRILEIEGRTTDYIRVSGKTIGSPVLTILMGRYDVVQYQIIQRGETIEIRMRKGPTFSQKDEQSIRESFQLNVSDSLNIEFDYTSDFIVTGNKNKFIVRID